MNPSGENSSSTSSPTGDQTALPPGYLDRILERAQNDPAWLGIKVAREENCKSRERLERDSQQGDRR
jgi:hypothetical protein